jgi:(E)-4-hydroxy-3-methylbut-2-enyl-diphosphate synthase
MVYAAGRQDHTVAGGDMVEHLVELVERKVAQIQAEEAAAKQAQAAE